MNDYKTIAAIMGQIEYDLPHGCYGLECKRCPLYGYGDGTREHKICKMLHSLGSDTAWSELFE